MTIRGLQVVRVDSPRNLLVIRGALPGPPGGLLTIRKTGKIAVHRRQVVKSEKKGKS